MMTSPAKTTLRLRTAAALTSAGITLAMLAGCSPQPEPTPTETPLFASEEEAFAAAEETYRAYTDASNDVALESPKTFEAVYAWLVDDALSSAKRSYSTMHAENLTLSGKSAFDAFELTKRDPDAILTEVCVDVSDIDVRTAAGDSVVPADRVNRQYVEVEFATADTSTGLAIARSTVLEGKTC